MACPALSRLCDIPESAVEEMPARYFEEFHPGIEIRGESILPEYALFPSSSVIRVDGLKDDDDGHGKTTVLTLSFQILHELTFKGDRGIESNRTERLIQSRVK